MTAAEQLRARAPVLSTPRGELSRAVLRALRGADAVHEQIVRREVIGGLLENEPALASEIACGIRSASFHPHGDRIP